MEPFILDLAIFVIAGVGINNNKMVDKRGKKDRRKGDLLNGLFFQQAKLYGMRPATAVFFIARAMVIRTVFTCGLVVNATVVIMILFVFLVEYRRNGRTGGGHAFTMADGVKVGCENSQQEYRFNFYRYEMVHYLLVQM